MMQLISVTYFVTCHVTSFLCHAVHCDNRRDIGGYAARHTPIVTPLSSTKNW